jgi:cyanophycinase
MSAGGWLALLGGGEFSFGETLEADRAWLEKAGDGPIGFVPAASGSEDYSRHFAEYLEATFARRLELVPIYRPRDARRARNAERIDACAAVYLGGGAPDRLIDALAGSVALEALRRKREQGGVVAAIAAAAQCCGAAVRSVTGRGWLAGLGLLEGVAVATNFDPGHDRRLRLLLGSAGVERGIGLAAGSALLLGPGGSFEAAGDIFALAAPDADLVPLVPGEQPAPGGVG